VSVGAAELVEPSLACLLAWLRRKAMVSCGNVGTSFCDGIRWGWILDRISPCHTFSCPFDMIGGWWLHDAWPRVPSDSFMFERAWLRL
jgi:hypothetical protein